MTPERFILDRKDSDRWTLVVVALVCGWIFSYPLRSHQVLLGFAQDDFYYYLKPAQNLAAGRGATFDGSTLTNGFHPLYFLLLTAASLFIHELPGVYRLLWCLDEISAVAIFLLVRKVFSRSMNNALLSNGLALCVLLPCLKTIFTQMEVVLALPLGFALLAAASVAPKSYTPQRCALIGVLGAFTMLARLDAAILVLLLLLGLRLIPEYCRVFSLGNVTAFAAASLPLPVLYFVVNYHYFHQLLPVSGSAKQLRHGWYPSHEVLTSFSGVSSFLIVLAVATGVLGLWIHCSLRPQEKLFCFASLTAPFVFFAIEMFVSDWKLWKWYFYALRFCAAGSFLLLGILLSNACMSGNSSILLKILPKMRFRAVVCEFVPAILYGLTIVILLRTRYRAEPIMVEIQEAALRLNAFAQVHPGRYAMGDRAGMFGYLSASPLLQAEGLVMDPAFLKHIRRQEDLRTVLASYGVDYYVVLTETKKERPGPCFHATEPVIAGPDALRMRSDFCEPPVYAFKGIDGTYRVLRVRAH